MLANNIYNKTRVKNSEILELLIYSAYIEEQSQLDEVEINTFKEVITYYYQEGQKEVDKKKRPSMIPEIILATILSMPNAKGYIWKDYKDAITKYNAEQIYRQATIDLQQQKELDITNDIYQNIIKRQNNSRLNINGDKISGDVDLTLIGMNNRAKMEGIYSFDENAEVEFVAVEDEVTTKMCHSLNGQRFKVHGWNEFKRYSKTNDSIVRYRCYGLVTGLNLPPIDDGFHWCRSTIMYVKSVEKQDKTEYNSVEYVRKNKITDNRVLDDKINKVKRLFPKYIQDYITNTPVETVGKGKNNHYLDEKLYLLNDATEEEIIHEIGHIIEEKLNIANDSTYQAVLRNNIGKIDVFNNEIGSIDGYDPDKYEFLLSGNNFISEYQRRVYNIDINGSSRINYSNGSFNYNVFRDYFPEGLRCYMVDKQMLKNKNIDLYNYIREVLNERK